MRPFLSSNPEGNGSHRISRGSPGRDPCPNTGPSEVEGLWLLSRLGGRPQEIRSFYFLTFVRFLYYFTFQKIGLHSLCYNSTICLMVTSRTCIQIHRAVWYCYVIFHLYHQPSPFLMDSNSVFNVSLLQQSSSDILTHFCEQCRLLEAERWDEKESTFNTFRSTAEWPYSMAGSAILLKSFHSFS